VTPPDCEKVKEIFDWASNWVSGHAESPVRDGDVPAGAEILAKINELKAVETNVKDHRKASGI